MVNAVRTSASAKGFSHDEVVALTEIVEQSIDRVSPEIETIPAVRELREQASAGRIWRKTKFPGRRKVDPVTFLMEQYGDEIRAGNLSRGQLAVLDPGLYVAVRDQLRATRDTDIREFIDNESDGRTSQSGYQRKTAACAAILGTDERSAARFFGNLRVDRIRPTDDREM